MSTVLNVIDDADFFPLVAYLGCEFHSESDGVHFCSHSCSTLTPEGNCSFVDCPLRDIFYDAYVSLEEFDPFPVDENSPRYFEA